VVIAAEPVETIARAVARYHAGCLRAIGAQNVALEDVRTAKKAAAACDVGWLADQEGLLSSGHLQLAPPAGLPAGPGDAEQDWLVWNRVRELTAKASTEPYAEEIVYAYPLFSLGRVRQRGVAPQRHPQDQLAATSSPVTSSTASPSITSSLA
jgi:hypothetical protein